MQFNDEDIDIIMEMARELTGTNVDRVKHSVIIQNVHSRVSNAGCDSLEAYLQYVDDHEEEMPFLLSALTIHTTSWFREAGAFEKLEKVVEEKVKSSAGTCSFRVLSVACSTGEEVYSLAIVLEHLRTAHPKLDYSIEGWDIDPISIRTARQGKYSNKVLEVTPLKFKQSLSYFFDRSKESSLEVAAQIKDRCKFRAINIIAPPVELEQYDFIICRNMLIYFNEKDMRSIVHYLIGRLLVGGHFCTGVSETSAVTGCNLTSIGSAVYQRPIDPKNSMPNKLDQINTNTTLTKPKLGAVLLVEDEVELREIMRDTLIDKGFKVFEAGNAVQGLEQIKAKAKEIGLVLCDFRMPPGKNGIELCVDARLVGFRAPFVIVSGNADQHMTMESSKVGCNDVVLKPLIGEELTRLVQTYVVADKSNEKQVGRSRGSIRNMPKLDLILFGASTGGTEALSRILKNMTRPCPPIVIVQHIATDFAKDFAVRLSSVAGLNLGQIEEGSALQENTIYMALGDYHLGLRQIGSNIKLLVSNEGPIHNHRPNIDFLFRSASKIKKNIFAALLTGMGKDGAEGLLALKEQGATTCAQDEDSCVVFGMPKEAIRLNAASEVMNPTEIREVLDAHLLNKI